VKSERGLSFFLMTFLAVTLACVSALATSTSIAARDNRLALEDMKTKTGILQRDLEDARSRQAAEYGFAGDATMPVESDSVVWVPLPQER
jgi:hypothetical protein